VVSATTVLTGRRKEPPLFFQPVSSTTVGTSPKAEWEKLQDAADIALTEREVIRLIRKREYQRVTVHVEGGEIVQADVAEEIALGESGCREQALLEIIKAQAYQTIEIVIRDGKVAKLSRKSPKKLRRTAGRT
jgi:hypothetical protein